MPTRLATPAHPRLPQALIDAWQADKDCSVLVKKVDGTLET